MIISFKRDLREVVIVMDFKVMAMVFVFSFMSFAVGYIVRKTTAEKKIISAETYAKNVLENAQKDAEASKKEKVLEAKEEIHKMRQEHDKEYKDRRNELQKFEKRLVQKEEQLDKKLGQVDERDKKLSDTEQKLKERESKIDEIREQQLRKLEEVSNLSVDEARKQVLDAAERDLKYELSAKIKELETKAKDEAEKNAREIVAYAIQKVAADQVSETTVSVVNLPNEEMKGRIIGREGRNIRAIENLTGVDLIVDDTPEAVVLSAFDPIRREVARIALEKLIADGRIHPARIEEMVDKARKEVDKAIKEHGEKALLEVGIYGMHPELVRLLGRLHYRTSYGQNVLKHSIEISHLCGIIAAELGGDVKLAKRAGLVHDIGKAVDHEMEGTHVEIGMDLLRRYKESDEVMERQILYIIDKDYKSISDFLKSKGYTSSNIVELKKYENGIVLNGTWAYMNQKPARFDRLLVRVCEYKKSENILPVFIKLDIKYEDEDIVVVSSCQSLLIFPKASL